MDKQSAFTLIEIVVVIGIFSLLAAVLIPYSIQQLNLNKSDVSTKLIYSKIFLTQQNAYTQLDDLSYGMELGNDSITIFSAYSTDNYFFSETIPLEAGITIKSKNLSGGVNKIYFPQGTLRPNSYGNFTVGDEANTYVIEINSEGLINYYRQ